jgi:hypothetical protein
MLRSVCCFSLALSCPVSQLASSQTLGKSLGRTVYVPAESSLILDARKNCRPSLDRSIRAKHRLLI